MLLLVETLLPLAVVVGVAVHPSTALILVLAALAPLASAVFILGNYEILNS
jgi:hypothetical protein